MVDHQFGRYDDPLPGVAPPAGGTVPPMEAAAHRTLARLEAQGLLEERHALICQTVMTLSASLARASVGGKAYAVGQVAAQLLAAIEKLPEPVIEDENDDAWTQLATELRDAASRHTP